MSTNITNGCEEIMENINGVPETLKTENIVLEDDKITNNSNKKPNNPKLLKKSQSEHLDLMNKNIRSLNGESGEDSVSAEGKRFYEYDFLLSLRNSPISAKKPENIPKLDLIAADIAHRVTKTQGRGEALDNGNLLLMGNSPFIPVFARSSPRGGTPSRRSQHGKQSGKDAPRSGGGGGGGGGGSGGGRQSSSTGSKPMIQINLSRDVKLNEAEHAWKPKRIQKDTKDVTTVDETADIEDLCKKFRSILNKLSPQNFSKLIKQVQDLTINTAEKLSGVIDLVFEKAIDEPGFSEIYALMCKELEQINVKQTQSDNSTTEVYSFRKLIIKRCQEEFEKASVAESASSGKLKEIDECIDLEKKKELQFNLDEEERKSRVRSVGNVRFIGELFKQKYIKCNIMIICIESLIKKLEEETMECLCKLLTTIGKDLEKIYNTNLQKYFVEMKSIAEDKDNKLNSRIRFMLKDVIDLRLNGWIPRQKLATPKKLDELNHESEMDRAGKNPYSKYSSSMSTQRDDRMYSGRNAGSRSVTEEGGWSVAPGRGNRGPRQSYVVDSAKLRMMNTSDSISDISLQPSTNAMWSRGSNTKKDIPTGAPKAALPSTTNKKNPTKTTNTFSVLGDLGAEVPSSEKSNTQVDMKKSNVTDEDLEKSVDFSRLKEEFLSCVGDPYSELLDNITHYFPKEIIPSVIRELILFGLAFSKSKILQVIGRATGTLVNNKTVTAEQFANAFKQSIDASPKIVEAKSEIWDLLSKFIWAHSKEHELSFWEIHKISTKIISIEKGFDFLMALFMEKVEDSNEVHVVKKLWEEAGTMNLIHWMSAADAEEFLKCMPLEFLSIETKEIVKAEPKSLFDSIMDLMKNHTSIDDFKSWIKENVEETEDFSFVRTLTEALHTHALCSPEFPEPRFDNKSIERLDFYYPLLVTYVANKPKLELECLLALQNLINKLEHPQGIALQLFEHLWEYGEAVSNNAFLEWETDTSQPEGKGVMLMSLTSFYTNLKSDDSSTEESEDNSG